MPPTKPPTKAVAACEKNTFDHWHMTRRIILWPEITDEKVSKPGILPLLRLQLILLSVAVFPLFTFLSFHPARLSRVNSGFDDSGTR